MNGLQMIAMIAAQDLALGQSKVISDGKGLSVTVKRRRDGLMEMKGNNRKSREALKL